MSRIYRLDESDSDSEDRNVAAAIGDRDRSASDSDSDNPPALPSSLARAPQTGSAQAGHTAGAVAAACSSGSDANGSADLCLASDSDEEDAVERRVIDITAKARFETGSSNSTSDRLVAQPRPAGVSDWQSNASSPHRCALPALPALLAILDLIPVNFYFSCQTQYFVQHSPFSCPNHAGGSDLYSAQADARVARRHPSAP
jgi:hypothetical protein